MKLRVVMEAIDKATANIKAVMNGSGAMAKAVRQARDSLKELEAANAKLESFRTTSRDLGIASGAAGAAQKSIASLRAEIAATENPTKAQNRALQDAINNAGRLKQQVQNLTEKQQRLRVELEQSGMPTRNLAQHQVDLRKRIDEVSQALDRQKNALKENGERMQRYHAAKAQAEKIRNIGSKAQSIGLASGAAGAAIGAATAFPVKAYADAEDAATQLKVAMMGVGGKVPETFAQIDALAGKLGNKLPGTTSDYQNMMTMLIRQGMSAQAILGGLGEATAYLGVQLKMPMDAAAEFASKLQDATRTSEKDMMGLMDTIQRTFYLGVDSDNMLQAFSKLSPAMATIRKQGLDAANAFAPLIVMADQAGMKGEAAGNAYRKVFQYVLDAKKLGKANSALKGTGIGLDFSDGKGEFGGLDKLFANLQKLKSLDTTRRNGVIKELFGDDAETLQAVSLMIDKGKAGYEEVQAKMAAQADIQKRVNAQLSTLKSLWDAATGTFTNAMVAFGESVAPELHATAEWLGHVAERTQAWAKENPGLASAIMTVAKWLGILLVGLAGVATVVAALAAPFAAMTVVLGAIGLSAAPVLAVVAAVALLVTGLALLYQKFMQVFDKSGWAGVGQAIIDGIWMGLDAATFGLLGKIGGLLDRTIAFAKDKLGIHSPSRVFAEIGGFTMAGLEQGLDEGGKDTLNTIGRITRQLTAAGVIGFSGAAVASGFAVDTRGPAAAGVQSAMPAGGNHYEIYIYPSPGMDLQAIGDMVVRKIEERDRQRAVQRRSRFSDLD